METVGDIYRRYGYLTIDDKNSISYLLKYVNINYIYIEILFV